MATRFRYAGARVFYWRSDSGKVYARRWEDYWDVLFTEWPDGWLATLGVHGIGKGGDGQYQPVFRGGARGHGFTANTVSPGMSDAGVMEQTPQEFQDAIRGWVESGWTPMRRQGTAEDIADVCALLRSDEARFVTGHGISVDGGSSLMNPDSPLALQVPEQVEPPNV